MKEDFSRFVEATLFPEGVSVQACFGNVLYNGTVLDRCLDERSELWYEVEFAGSADGADRSWKYWFKGTDLTSIE